ncbi:MAG TPA: choice-of-anchor D domain-containing protein [Kofleriaceae bacterium]|nr:choice-of-anchor D domain-containing protein [Kofleriaceae bacterium]
MSKRWLGLLFVLLWIGRGDAARAAVTPSGALGFGPVVVGQTSAAMNETFTVGSSDPSSVTIAAKTGACDQFAVNPTTVSLPVNGSASTAVTFKPTTSGAKSCTFDVLNGPTSVATFDVSGTGTAAAPTPMIDVQPTTPLPFGTIEVGDASLSQQVTIKNVGTGTLAVTAPFIVTAPANYKLNPSPVDLSLGTGEATILNVACQPQSQGVLNDKLRIVSNDAARGTIDVAVTCTGNLGKLVVDQKNLVFGALSVGDHKDILVTLTNTGNVSVDTLSASITGGAGYSLLTPLTKTSLAPNDTATTTIRFMPAQNTDGGTATLTFQGKWGNNDLKTAVETATLSGQVVALAVPTTTVALGDFRFDSPKSGTFTIQNQGSADLNIDPLGFMPDLGTSASEISFDVKDGPTTVDLTKTQKLVSNHTFTVTVTATPNNRAGAIGGKIIVHSPLAGFVDKTVVLTGNAQAAQVQVGNVDFGPIDIANPTPTTLAATLKNTGNASLDVGAFTVAGATGVFTVIPPPAQSLLAGASITVNVTYKPTAIHAADAPDMLTLTASTAGALGGPAQAMLTVRGRGIGRQIVPPQTTPTVPTTFRNPGTLAPVVPVTIGNSGEAVLHVKAAMVTGGGVWSIVDPNPVDIPGGGSHDFLVKFTPTEIGAAPIGQLAITSVDNANTDQVTTVALTGAAMARNVAFGAPILDPNAPVPTIELGVAGVNLPITVDDLLTVTNLDPGNAFTIHQIVVEAGSPFTLDRAPNDQALAASAAAAYAVTFSPTARGEFTATATLYLDQDPVPHAQVKLHGTADEVAAHGGGGCNTGHSGGTGGLVLGLAALGLVRRRRQAVAS